MFAIPHSTKAHAGGIQVANNDVSFVVKPGEIFGLLGHNGAGKTTLINMLTGMTLPTGGDARVAGYSIHTDMARVRERLSVCPQDNPIWEEFTVREHLRFFAVCRQVSTAAVDSEVTKYCHALGLAEKLDEPCGKLSGGQKRRLWVATCLLGDCDVLLMDEPTSGMDPQARRDFWVLLKELSKTERRAVVFSTHYLEEADLLADRKVVLAAGEVRAIGTSKELKRQFGTGYWLNFALKAGAAGSKSGAVAASLSSATSGGGASGGGAGAVDTPKASQAAKSKILDFIAGRLCCSAGGGTTSEEESQRAKDAVRRSLLNVRRETRRGGASDSRLLSVCIPWDRVSRLGPLLDAIEDHLGELQIEQYSVEMTSLEEVFMRVGEEELQQRLGRRGGGTSTTSSTTGIGSPGATFPASRIAADTAEDSTSDMNLGLGTGAAATAEGNPRLGDARVAETTTGRSSSSSASDVVAVEDGLLPRALTRRRQVWATVVMKWRVFANLPTFLYVLLFYFLFIIWFFLYVGWDSASTHAEWMSLQSSEFQKRYEAFLESQEFRDKFADSVPEAFRAAESVAVAAAGAAGASSASSAAATSAATTCDEESSATLAEMLPDDARRQIRASLYPAFVADVMSGIAVRMANMVCIPIFIYCIRIIVPCCVERVNKTRRLAELHGLRTSNYLLGSFLWSALEFAVYGIAIASFTCLYCLPFSDAAGPSSSSTTGDGGASALFAFLVIVPLSTAGSILASYSFGRLLPREEMAGLVIFPTMMVLLAAFIYTMNNQTACECQCGNYANSGAL